MILLIVFVLTGGLLAAYAAWLASKMLDPKKAPVWRPLELDHGAE